MADFPPLFQETGDSVQARLDADVNAGLVATDTEWIDTREGTFYADVTGAVGLEIARLWDALGNEVPAVAFPSHAWGTYLDAHAETFNLVRESAVSSTGIVYVNGDAGTLMPQGTAFSTDPASDGSDPIVFESTAAATIGAVLPQVTLPGTPLTASGSGGVLATGTYYYFVASKSPYGETLPKLLGSIAVTGPTGSVAATWIAAAGATGYSIYRGPTNSSADAVLIGSTTAAVTFNDTTANATTTAPNVEDLSAGAAVSVAASDAGAAGDVGANAINNLDTPLVGITTVWNPAATSGGVDEETDEQLRTRILLEFAGQGAGTMADYKRWALSYPGVGRVYVEAAPSSLGGAGAVLVVVTKADGTPVSQSVVLGVQTLIDPTRQGWGTTSGITRGETSGLTAAAVGTTYTFTVASGHGVTAGMTIVVSGFTPAAYNGTFVVTSVGATTIVVTGLTSGPGASTVSGTISPTLTDSTAAWTANQWVGKYATIDTGANQVLARVVSNTATQLCLAAGWKKLSDNSSSTPTSPKSYTIGESPLLASGLGYAPVGAAVTVKTPTALPISIVATITLKPGFSLATEQASIITGLQRYFADMIAGTDVIYNRIRAAFFDAQGVSDVTALTIGTGGSSGIVDLAVTTDQVATFDSTTGLSITAA